MTDATLEEASDAAAIAARAANAEAEEAAELVEPAKPARTQAKTADGNALDANGRRHIRVVFYGAGLDLMSNRDIEVCEDGPAGTGKTVNALYKLHFAAIKYPGMRGLVSRRTNVDLAASAMVTYQEQILTPGDGVEYFGGNQVRPPAFLYPNGSEIAITGLDKASKVKSRAYDLIYINEATEIDLETLEMLRGRLRNGVMPYQQLIMDCNPDAPYHWLNVRMNEGLTTRLRSRHEDNPAYFDRESGQWTELGKRYVSEVLAGLTGVRADRLVKGLWVAAEGIIYTSFDPATHVIPRFAGERRGDPPRDWPRYLVIDFGYTHPFCCQWWAIDGDGRAYMYREIYMSNREVAEHAEDIKRLALRFNDPLPRRVIADPEDADGRRTITRITGYPTVAAHKDVLNGIQAMQGRLKLAGDGKPRMYFLENSLVELDASLLAHHKPVRTVDEFSSYIWDTRLGQRRGEQPVTEDDHGVSCARYLTAYFDLTQTGVSYAPSPFA